MPQPHGHTLKAFDRDMAELRGLITDMGAFAEAAIEEAMRCLVERDRDAAHVLVEADVQLDELEAEAERRVVELIALRAPMADDLRDAIAALKIAGVVERIGDYAKNIARRVRVFPRRARSSRCRCSRRWRRSPRPWCTTCLPHSSSAMPTRRVAVCRRDDAVDDFYESIFRTLLTYMMEDPQNIGPSTTLLFVAKNLERIGDHATNIAEMVYYAATGERLVDGGD